MPSLVERDCHHWMFTIVERNLQKGIPIIESGEYILPLFESGEQEPMDPSNNILLPLVDRYGWKVLHVWLPHQRN